jgi:hypothetical protein
LPIHGAFHSAAHSDRYSSASFSTIDLPPQFFASPDRGQGPSAQTYAPYRTDRISEQQQQQQQRLSVSSRSPSVLPFSDLQPTSAYTPVPPPPCVGLSVAVDEPELFVSTSVPPRFRVLNGHTAKSRAKELHDVLPEYSITQVAPGEVALRLNDGVVFSQIAASKAPAHLRDAWVAVTWAAFQQLEELDWPVATHQGPLMEAYLAQPESIEASSTRTAVSWVNEYAQTRLASVQVECETVPSGYRVKLSVIHVDSDRRANLLAVGTGEGRNKKLAKRAAAENIQQNYS